MLAVHDAALWPTDGSRAEHVQLAGGMAGKQRVGIWDCGVLGNELLEADGRLGLLGQGLREPVGLALVRLILLLLLAMALPNNL